MMKSKKEIKLPEGVSYLYNKGILDGYMIDTNKISLEDFKKWQIKNRVKPIGVRVNLN